MENPQRVIDLKRQVFEFKSELWAKVLQFHEVEGLTPFMPELGEPTPIDMMLNQMRQALEQAGQQVETLSQQNQLLQWFAEAVQGGANYDSAQLYVQAKLGEQAQGGRVLQRQEAARQQEAAV